MRNAATERARELRNQPAGTGKRAQKARKIPVRRNEAKELLKTKELAFSGARTGLPFQGKKPPSKPLTWRKIHHLWGIYLSARSRMNRHILDGYSTSSSGLGGRRLQLFTKCPFSLQRRRSEVGLASGMLWTRLWGSIYKRDAGA
jgi:hypothetical protein